MGISVSTHTSLGPPVLPVFTFTPSLPPFPSLSERGGELPEEALPGPLLPPRPVRHLLPRVRLLPARGRSAPPRPDLRAPLRPLQPLHLRGRQRHLPPPGVPASTLRPARHQARPLLPRVHRYCSWPARGAHNTHNSDRCFKKNTLVEYRFCNVPE